MPRQTLTPRKYRVQDFTNWVRGRMSDSAIKQSIIAKEMGISQPAFSQKLKNKSLTYEDALILFKKLEATDEEILKLMKY